MTPQEIEAKTAECYAFAEEFAQQFPELKVNCARFQGGAMAAVGLDGKWGFTAKFVFSHDGVIHMHAFLETVGLPDQLEFVAEQFKKGLP